MSQYNGMTLTVAGLALETKAQTGVAIHFTRMALGEGTLATGQLLSSLTNLIDHKLDLPIIVCDVTGTGTAQLQAVLQNNDLVKGFWAREIGVYATDPDAGEILYAVANAGTMADYIPAGGGADVVDLILSIITVVGQASTVTAEINTSLLFATVQALNDHKNSANPHPYFLKLGPAVTTCNSIIVQQSDPKTINPMTVDDAKKLILGGDGIDISTLRSNDATLFRAVQEAALQREADGLAPGWSLLFGENFEDCDALDVFACSVQSVAGDDTILVDSVKGLLTGSWYTISDGVNQELIQIKSIIKNGSDLRVIATQDLTDTYQQGKTSMYRSTAQITTSAGMALGAGDQRAKTWTPAVTFTGVTSNVVQTAALDTSLTNQALTVTGDGAFTADGYFTLK